MNRDLRDVTLLLPSGQERVQKGLSGIKAGDKFRLDDTPGMIYTAEKDAEKNAKTGLFEVVAVGNFVTKL